MNKSQAIKELDITDKQLDLLEYDFLKIHKEYIEIINKADLYPMWYVQALMQWREKRKFIE